MAQKKEKGFAALDKAAREYDKKSRPAGKRRVKVGGREGIQKGNEYYEW